MRTVDYVVNILLVAVIAMLFNIIGWTEQIDTRLKRQSEILQAQSLNTELLRFGREKQKEIDELKVEFNELVDSAEALGSYIDSLELQILVLKFQKSQKTPL